jgi:hypothetical protein
MCVCAIDVVLHDRIAPCRSWQLACFTLSLKTASSVGLSRRAAPIARSIEEYFSICKRKMKRIHQHCDGKHLHRYLAEFDFRYNTRAATTTFMRAEEPAISIKGKRLTCRRPCKKPYPPQAGSEALSALGEASWQYVS